jgi:hypothetical protein
LVRDEFAAALQEKRLFQYVVTQERDIKPGARVLKLQTSITEFRSGRDGAMPMIGIFGKIVDPRWFVASADNAQPVFQFDSRRIGTSTVPNQTADIRSMAKALAEFIRRNIH